MSLARIDPFLSCIKYTLHPICQGEKNLKAQHRAAAALTAPEQSKTCFMLALL
jgi:hypothetical protein